MSALPHACIEGEAHVQIKMHLHLDPGRECTWNIYWCSICGCETTRRFVELTVLKTLLVQLGVKAVEGDFNRRQLGQLWRGDVGMRGTNCCPESPKHLNVVCEWAK